MPPLALPFQDTKELRALSKQLEHEALAQYEYFAWRWGRDVNGSCWKAVRTSGSLCAFSERSTSTDKYKRKPKNTPRLLITGTVMGTVEDALYGLTFQDTGTLQALVPGAEVVLTLKRGSFRDPFRFVGVTKAWQSSTKTPVFTVVSSGLARLRNGEEVGIIVRHAFHAKRAPVTTLTVLRQQDPGRLKIWSVHLNVLDNRASQRHSARREMATFNIACYVGLRRKVSWLLHRRLALLSESAVIEPTSAGCVNACEICCRPKTKLLGRTRTTCRLCLKVRTPSDSWAKWNFALTARDPANLFDTMQRGDRSSRVGKFYYRTQRYLSDVSLVCQVAVRHALCSRGSSPTVGGA